MKTEQREYVKKRNNNYFKNMEDKLVRRRPRGIEKARKVGNEESQTVSNLLYYCSRGLKLIAHFRVEHEVCVARCLHFSVYLYGMRRDNYICTADRHSRTVTKLTQKWKLSTFDRHSRIVRTNTQKPRLCTAYRHFGIVMKCTLTGRLLRTTLFVNLVWIGERC